MFDASCRQCAMVSKPSVKHLGMWEKDKVRPNTRDLPQFDKFFLYITEHSRHRPNCTRLIVDINWVLFSSQQLSRRYGFLQAGFAIIVIIGRRCARIYNSCIFGSASDRMTLPIDMKNLSNCQRPANVPKEVFSIPKGSTRTKHILAESPHDSVGPSAITEDVDGS